MQETHTNIAAFQQSIPKFKQQLEKSASRRPSRMAPKSEYHTSKQDALGIISHFIQYSSSETQQLHVAKDNYEFFQLRVKITCVDMDQFCSPIIVLSHQYLQKQRDCDEIQNIISRELLSDVSNVSDLPKFRRNIFDFILSSEQLKLLSFLNFVLVKTDSGAHYEELKEIAEKAQKQWEEQQRLYEQQQQSTPLSHQQKPPSLHGYPFSYSPYTTPPLSRYSSFIQDYSPHNQSGQSTRNTTPFMTPFMTPRTTQLFTMDEDTMSQHTAAFPQSISMNPQQQIQTIDMTQIQPKPEIVHNLQQTPSQIINQKPLTYAQSFQNALKMHKTKEIQSTGFVGSSQVNIPLLLSVLQFGKNVNLLVPMSTTGQFMAKIVPDTMSFWKQGGVEKV
ncbi:MAG: hypothetical protein EZS28_004686 [Streblomastix strix]|uniref:Uncharacterized protein n=1 Tax=Streblomastix strix TaxID=222440 RepID=A0A5J4WZ93_9EUKA|nr:MAG: hypothetical protein EZS28_004686 [Streblomastix strix]